MSKTAKKQPEPVISPMDQAIEDYQRARREGRPITACIFAWCTADDDSVIKHFGGDAKTTVFLAESVKHDILSAPGHLVPEEPKLNSHYLLKAKEDFTCEDGRIVKADETIAATTQAEYIELLETGNFEKVKPNR